MLHRVVVSIAFAAILSVAIATPGYAQQATGATLLEEGVYSAQRVSGPDERSFSNNYVLVKAGTVIDHSEFRDSQFADHNPRVGFFWRPEGSPQGAVVTIVTHQLNPDGKKYRTEWPREIGDKTWNGTKVGDWTGYIGKLLIELWFGNRKLNEVVFDIR